MLKRLSTLLIVLFCALVAVTKATGDTVYVDLSATGANNGTSWANAYKNLQNAIITEPGGKIFLVAKGDYYPSAATIDPNASFNLKDSVQLWGGFPAGGSSFASRNAATNVTVLSGDLNKNNIRNYNSDAYTVVTIFAVTGTIVIDGFTIKGGDNTGSQGGGILIRPGFTPPIYTHVYLTHNIIEGNAADDGGGVYYQTFNADTLTVSKCTIRNNFADNNAAPGVEGRGGGMYIDGECRVFTNLIYKNTAFNGGGFFASFNGFEGHFVNNTVAYNLGGNIKGILYNKTSGGVAKFYNNVVFNNQLAWNYEIVQKLNADPPATDAYNNVCENNSLRGINNNQIVAANNPDVFLNGPADDFRPGHCSAANEAGDSLKLAQETSDTLDFLESDRYYDGDYNGFRMLDAGAIEGKIVCEKCSTNAGPSTTICGLTQNLNAMKLGFMRTGVWTKFAGPGNAAFTSNTTEATSVTVDKQGTYIFSWHMSGPYMCDSIDTVSVTFFEPPIAKAGPNAPACGLKYNLAAVLSTGTGKWTSTDAGVTFTNATVPTTQVTVPTYGTYTFTWTESNGVCTPSVSTVNITFYNNPTANAGINQQVCGTTTNLKAIPSLGTGTWSYVSGPPSSLPAFGTANSPTSSATITPTGFGKYVYRWTEVNGNCPAVSDTMTVIYDQPPVADAGSNIDTCGLTAKLKANTSIPGFNHGKWTWLTGPDTIKFNQNNDPNTLAYGKKVGLHTIRWTESNGVCPSTFKDISINFTPASTANLVYLDDRYCGVNDVVSLQIDISGFAPYTFTLQSENTSDVITTSNGTFIYDDNGVTKGQSVVTWKITNFKDGSGCSAIFQNNLIKIPRKGTDLLPVNGGFNAINDTICGSATAYLTLQYNNNDDLQFVIEDVAHSTVLTPINYAAGSGQITIPVGNLVYGVNKFRLNSVKRIVGGCDMVMQGSQEIDVVYKPVQFTLNPLNLTCFGANDGSISLSNVVYAPDFTKAFVNSVFTPELITSTYLFNLEAKTYTVQIVNAAGCEQTKSVTLSQPPQIVVDIVPVNPTCYGYSNGSVEFKVSGGSGKFTTFFKDLSYPGSFKFIGQKAGDYYAKVTDDNNGCIVPLDSIKLTQPDSLTITTVPVDVNCDGTDNGNITINVIGGTPVYAGSVSLGSFNQSLPDFSTTTNVGGLKIGDYMVKIIDSKGCFGSVHTIIKEGVELVYNAVKLKDEDCASGGIIQVTKPAQIPGTKYSIDGIIYLADTIFKNLTAGKYTVYAKTPAGCIRTYQYEIENKNIPMTAKIVITKTASCNQGNDGEMKVTITGGSGNFKLYLDGDPTGTTNTVFQGLSVGTHKIRVLDVVCGYLFDLKDSIINPAPYSVTIDTVISPSCSYTRDGFIRLKPVGGNLGNFQFSLDSGKTFQYGNQFNNLPDTNIINKEVIKVTNYNFLAKDSKGCKSQVLNYELKVPDSLTITFQQGAQNAVNRTSTVKIIGGGGTPRPGDPPYYYSMNSVSFNDVDTFPSVKWGYVFIYIKDANGCRNELRFNLGMTGIETVSGAEAGIKIYPNPSNGLITIESEQSATIQDVTVINGIGQEIMKINASNIHQGQLDLSALSKGVYQLLVRTDKTVGVVTVELTN